MGSEKLFKVRQYDGFDHTWIDVTGAVTHEEALKVFNTYTANGTRKTSYEHIDYYAIFPADTRMLYSEHD